MTPVWSKDSQRLAYIRGDDIWIMSKSGAGAVNIPNSPAPERGVPGAAEASIRAGRWLHFLGLEGE